MSGPPFARVVSRRHAVFGVIRRHHDVSPTCRRHNQLRWKTSAHRFKNLERLAVKYLAIPATSAPSERIWSRAARVLTAKRNRLSEEVSSAMMYCKENRELLHKYYAEIAKERMHPNDHHLIERHKALLPTFEHEKDAQSNIDVGVDEEEV